MSFYPSPPAYNIAMKILTASGENLPATFTDWRPPFTYRQPGSAYLP
jgi:hypothetical protein